ncbi:hypothetical protein JMJ35_003663 [Cladonia borealis]|uniref:DUF7587 domain-containing protein n=1 Tax=Cladonia borealis TaxID=184061 RepID=A0AA39UBZ9_9LECA|nr:hypothetical protein JMJ35_003663 [Cladonia borealis]
MAFSNIADELQTLSLSDPEYLLFCPSGDKAWLREKFNDIPRYLFRIFTPKSCGMTDTSWTKSMDARYTPEKSRVDIFARQDNEQVASMLNTHLRWREGLEDNFVSWTSSLLFALIYIFHLHANSRNGSAFDNIFLCIIDTTNFPKEVFLRDMDLIQVYSPFDTDLEDFKGLRLRKDMYFGEYLSQGALKIEGKCQIVSAQAMIDQDLYELRREFKEFALWELRPRPPWAYPVVDLRKDLFQIESPEISNEKLRVAVKVAELFGSCWTLPIAANLIALLPGPKEDVAIIQALFRVNVFTGSLLHPKRILKLTYLDNARKDCSPLKTKVVAYESLPEVKQFGKMMQNVYKDFCVTKLRSKTPMAYPFSYPNFRLKSSAKGHRLRCKCRGSTSPCSNIRDERDARASRLCLLGLYQ